MKCPICGNKLEIKNKQIGTDNSGDPVFNEYAVCRDCKKQWNLDKQRAKKDSGKGICQKKPKRQIRPAAKKTRATLLKKRRKQNQKRRTKSRKQLIPAAPKNALLQKLPQKASDRVKSPAQNQKRRPDEKATDEKTVRIQENPEKKVPKKKAFIQTNY